MNQRALVYQGSVVWVSSIIEGSVDGVGFIGLKNLVCCGLGQGGLMTYLFGL